jgi:hypothetical protein
MRTYQTERDRERAGREREGGREGGREGIQRAAVWT